MRTFARVAGAFLLCLLGGTTPAQVKDKGKPPGNAIETVPTLVSEVDGRTFEEWKADLQHADPSVRTEAILAIVRFGPRAAEAVPLLLKRCLDLDASPRV